MKEKEKPPAREQITLRIPEDLCAELRQAAKEQGIPVNQLAIQILQRYRRESSQN